MNTAHATLGSTCGCDSQPDHPGLISLDAGLACIARETRTLKGAETVALAQSTGRVLAASVRARGMVPAFDNSAMDGYALHTASLTGPGPWDLPVSARIAAGQEASARLAAGTAAQIFTGARMPDGADAVVMQERVECRGDRIHLSDRIQPGTHIRKAGEDMLQGKIVVPAGRCLTARDIAACAAAGHDSVLVSRRIRVALLVTGDEVCAPGATRGASGIWDVNTPMLSAAIAGPQVDLCRIATAADTRDALRAQIDALADSVDLIVTTGGLSVGAEDHVKPALSDLGARIGFSGVALKPGKPVSFGHLRRAVWLGLPGNPLSAFVTWQVFGTALCAALSGRTGQATPRRHVVLPRALRHKPGRCELRLARLAGFDATGREFAEFPDATHSGRVASLPEMDGLLFIPAEAEHLPKGALVEFHPF